MRRYLRAIAGGAVLAFSLGLAAGPSSPAPIYFMASQPGRPAHDGGKGGGPPFSVALAELLDRPKLSFGDLLEELVKLTERNSRGQQCPEVPAVVDSVIENWQIRPQAEREKRVALVLVFADYSRNESLLPLPGARSDLDRVASALEKAGFATTRILDPSSPLYMKAVMDGFAKQSTQADVAVLYATGHGVEVDQAIHLLPGDFSPREDKLVDRGIRLAYVAGALKARKLNLIFYGGCRTPPSKLETRGAGGLGGQME
jgi:hypothetical protein